MNIYERLLALDARWVRCSPQVGQEIYNLASEAHSVEMQKHVEGEPLSPRVVLEANTTYTMRFRDNRNMSLQVREKQRHLEFNDRESDWYGAMSGVCYRCDRHEDCRLTPKLGEECQRSIESICEWISGFIRTTKGRPFILGCSRSNFDWVEEMIAANFKRVLRKKVKLEVRDMSSKALWYCGRFGYTYYYLW